jgi:hypothetical protein
MAAVESAVPREESAAVRTFQFGKPYSYYALGVLLSVGTFNIIDRTVVNLLLSPSARSCISPIGNSDSLRVRHSPSVMHSCRFQSYGWPIGASARGSSRWPLRSGAS